jgi:hypothetical protein
LLGQVAKVLNRLSTLRLFPFGPIAAAELLEALRIMALPLA